MTARKSQLDWNRLNSVFAARVRVPLQLGAADPELVLDLAEERAAIMEYDGGLTRQAAEKLAYIQHGLLS